MKKSKLTCQELCDMIIKYYEPEMIKQLMHVATYGNHYYFLPTKSLKVPDMKFNYGDKILVTALWAVRSEEEGEIIMVDRVRQQYKVSLASGKEIWCTEEELNLPASRRALSPAFTSYNDSTACKHQFVLYVGLTETFNHCKSCGVKEHESD